jgi:poly(3-hydroxybutyrate) depolymerase
MASPLSVQEDAGTQTSQNAQSGGGGGRAKLHATRGGLGAQAAFWAELHGLDLRLNPARSRVPFLQSAVAMPP